MRMTLRALSALLAYPSSQLQAHVAEVRDALQAEAVLSQHALEQLEPLLQTIEAKELLDLQADYSALFDQCPSLSLHLFEHVHGESRERGQAMIDLGSEYVQRGFYMEASELPDYLPLFLEFLSCQPAAEAQEWLGQPVHVLAALEQRLMERGTPYAAVFQSLRLLADAQPDPAAVAELKARIRRVEEKPVDQVWEEAPVTFNTPIQGQGTAGAASACNQGQSDNGAPVAAVIARLKAAREAIGSAFKG